MGDKGATMITARRRPRVVQWIVLPVMGVVGALLIVAYLSSLHAAVESEQAGACLALQPEPLSGAARPFTLPDLNGERRSLKSFQGKVVLLNFWATWCPPCVEELPSMMQLQRTLDPRDFTMLTVSVDDTADVVKAFIARHRSIIGGLQVLMDPSKKTPTGYGTSKFPETYLIDREGQLRFRFINKRDWSSPAAVACLRSLM
jgi:cytochrome c biogenesis protein CcmG, thiol:disulfide interchange protein DsbE